MNVLKDDKNNIKKGRAMRSDVARLEKIAHDMRKRAIQLAYSTGKNGAHLGGGLSAIEIMAVLYCGVMRHTFPAGSTLDCDHFVLSKGHATLAYYTALFEAGFFDEETLKSFEQDGGPLSGQPSRHLEYGIECSSGSLGMGLSFAAGMALALKKKDIKRNVYVLIGDGECNEGSVWEAVMSAYNLGLDNLVAIVDMNGLQSDGPTFNVMRMFDMQKAWEGFGWQVDCVDGHNVADLYDVFMRQTRNRPRVILAKTIKGKGISFMENQPEWHHGSLSEKQYLKALNELGEQ